MTIRNDGFTTLVGILIIGWIAFRSRSTYNIDPGLVKPQMKESDLQISDQQVPDMQGYTEKSELTGQEADVLLTKATQILREKTKMCWEPIETQYATRYSRPNSTDSIVWSRITFTATKQFFARDYTVAMKDDEIIYIQTESEFSSDPHAPRPYDKDENTNQTIQTSIELLNQLAHQ